jgi:hypothetical protein
MNQHKSKALRVLLRANPDGMSVTELADRIGVTPDGARKSLKHMPDAYITRWEPTTNGRFMSIWCVVVPPPNAPNPEVLDIPPSEFRAIRQQPARVTPRQPAAPKAAPAPSNHKPQGMTQIRGPWPTFH